ncbi:MAG: SpoIIE family protein phosphatase [Calditrichaeota bacterium]|nr:SpoIIE family protein phosphatase [Calditrichota bacterium]
MKIITLKRTNLILFVLSIFFLAFIFLIDLGFYYTRNYPSNIYGLREFMIVFALLFFSSLIYRQHYIQEKDILFKLKSLFVAILGVYLATALPKFLLPIQYYKTTTDLPVLFSSLMTLLHSTFVSIFATLFFIAILFILRDLIFYKSKKGTRRLFWAGLILLLIYVLYEQFQYGNAHAEWSFKGRDRVEWILSGAMLIVMMLLSFRTAWVNMLNKKQKILTFWAGVLILPGAIALSRSSSYQSIYYYSLTVAAFDAYVAYFVYIYVLFSLFSILLHLPTASIFDRKMNEISSLHNLSRTISSVMDYDAVLKKVTELTTEVLSSDYCWLEMIDPSTEARKIVSWRGINKTNLKHYSLDGEEGNLSHWIIRNKYSVLINDVSKDLRVKHLKFWKKDLNSLLAVPLISKGNVIGILYAAKRTEFGFDNEDRELLQAFANQATVAIENANLLKESIERERLAQELRVAHETQLKLLPKQMPAVEQLDIEGICITANEVGGDYYGFISLDDSRLGIIIGDVSGKGISAAFYMAELKGIIEAYARIYQSPKELLSQMNRVLYQNVDRQTFVSLIYAIVDLQKNRIRFSRAGHCPLLVISPDTGEVLRFQPAGMGLALDEGKLFDRILDEQELPIRDGNIFVFYTDGLTEARNPEGDEFGEERLTAVLSQIKGKSASEIVDTIVHQLKSFVGEARQHDDISILVVRVKKP